MNFKIVPNHAYFAALIIVSAPTLSSDDINFDLLDITNSQSEQNNENKSLHNDEFDTILSNINYQDLQAMRSCQPGEALTWLVLIDQFKIAEALNQQIYKKTSIPLDRNLITYPNIQLCSYQQPVTPQFTTHLFYNQTSKKQYRASTEHQEGTRIGSYLNIENKALLKIYKAISDSSLVPINTRNTLKNVNVDLLSFTLANARLEERRVGVIGHFYHPIKEQGYFEAKMPLYWMLRNLNYTAADKEIIDKQLSIFQGSDFDEDVFAKKHLIFDAFGTGTLELSFCKQMWEGHNWTLDIGGSILLPTDHILSKGLYGTYIEPSNKDSVLEFCSLDIENFNSDTTKVLETYFTSALDHLSSILLQCPLGYNKQVGFGLKMLPNWEIRPDLQFKGLYSFDILLPYEQERFFVLKDISVFSQEFEKMPQSTDKEAQAKLAFLQQRLTDLLFPRVRTAKIFSGIVFTSTSCLHKTYKNWNFVGGYNGWYRSSEKLLKLTKMNQSDTIPFDLHKSLNDTSYAVKLFGKVHKILHSKRHNDFSVALWADGTIFNHGIGNDFSIGISLDSKF